MSDLADNLERLVKQYNEGAYGLADDIATLVIMRQVEICNALRAQETSTALTIPGDWPADYQKQFWDRYPNKVNKKDALKKLDKVARAGKTKWADLMSGLERYIICDKVQNGFIMGPDRWVLGEHWNDQYGSEPAGGRRVQRSAHEIAADLLSR